MDKTIAQINPARFIPRWQNSIDPCSNPKHNGLFFFAVKKCHVLSIRSPSVRLSCSTPNSHSPAVESSPNDPTVWNMLGVCYSRLRRLRRARWAYRQTVRHSPRSYDGEYPVYAWNLGLTLLDLAEEVCWDVAKAAHIGQFVFYNGPPLQDRPSVERLTNDRWRSPMGLKIKAWPGSPFSPKLTRFFAE